MSNCRKKLDNADYKLRISADGVLTHIYALNVLYDEGGMSDEYFSERVRDILSSALDN